MKRTPFLMMILCLFALLPLTASSQQDTGVYAEAFSEANLRAVPNIDGALVGNISSGTRYPVVGRSEFFPWLLLGDRDTFSPLGWVFQDIVQVYGDVNLVPFSSVEVGQPTAPPPSTPPPGATAAPTNTPVPQFTVAGIARGEINVRYGPGIDYDRVGVARPGDRFEVTAYHTQFPWVQIAYDNSPTGFAWIQVDLLDYEGDRFSLPAISATFFNQPTLTPTPPPVFSSAHPWGGTTAISPQFSALALSLFDLFVQTGFDPATSQFGALYVEDLQTGEAFTFGNDVAFSGTSINKIAILVRLFGALDRVPTPEEAVDIANTMICSENVATNELLRIIGDGDMLLGADRVTEFLQTMGMNNTFLAAPFNTVIPGSGVEPTAPARAPNIPDTPADGNRVEQIDFVNQMTVDEMGWLLSSVYECAFEGTGPLLDLFPGQYTSSECQTMLHVMSNNTVDGLLKAGVPEGVQVAHKHGWIDNTHGNAGVMFTEGGNYVVVMMLHKPVFLSFLDESLPLLAETSRRIYNYYNPSQPLSQIREGFIPEAPTCNLRGDPLIAEISAPEFDPPFDGPIPTREGETTG